MSDPLPDAAEAVRLLQNLALVALGRRPADRAIAVGRLFAAYAGVWLEDQEVVVAGCRVADVGPTGSWRGEAAERVDRRRLLAMPGFGEVREPIESAQLTPEREAALVLTARQHLDLRGEPRVGQRQRRADPRVLADGAPGRQPAQIFVQPGSAVPPSAWEETSGRYGAPRCAPSWQTPRSRGSARWWTDGPSGTPTTPATPGGGR